MEATVVAPFQPLCDGERDVASADLSDVVFEREELDLIVAESDV